jgi:hypothetical protein
MLVSPDDEWIAFVQQDVCADGYFTTVVTCTVQIVPEGGTPSRENDVFTVDSGGRWQNRPVTQWLSPRALQITAPNKSLVGLSKSGFEEVEVVIKFEPDDPVERRNWLRKLGISSSPKRQ